MNKKILILFLFFLSFLSFAQTNEGEIEDAQILIEKNSNIILPKVDKSINKILLENKNIDKKQFSFDTIKYQVPTDNKKIDKTLRDLTSYFGDKNIFLDLKTGNYSSYYLQTNPYLKSGNDFVIYSDILLDFRLKGQKLNTISEESTSDLNLFVDYKLNSKSNITTHLNYNSIKSGYYGFTEENDIALSDDLIKNLKFTNNLFYYKINFESVENEYFYNVSYSGKSFQNNFNYELFQNFNSTLSLPLSNFLLSFKPSYYSYNLENISLNNNVLFSDLSIPLVLDYYTNKFNIRINGMYQLLSRDFKNKKTMSSFSPEIKIKYNLDNVTFKLSYSKGITYDKLSSILTSMPFIYDPNISQFDFNEEFYNLNAGVDLSVYYSTKVSFNFNSVNSIGGLDYAIYDGENLPISLKNPLYLYSLKRKNVEEVINTYSFSFRRKFSNRINSSLDFVYTQYEEKEVFLPLYYIDFITSYSQNKFHLTVGTKLELETYGLNYQNELFKMNSYIDVYLESLYNISDRFEFSFNLNNILNRYNERFFMYPDLAINFMGGVKWYFK